MKKIKIFLDVDDTLAHTSLSIANNYKINNYLINNKINSMINFPKALKAWKNIKQSPHFWENLPLTPFALDLYNYSLEITEDISVLTALPKLIFPNKDAQFSLAEQAKRKWLEQHFPQITQQVIHVGYAKEKHLHIKPDYQCILIDDSKSNIKRWNAAGGTGILVLHTGIQETMLQLKKLKKHIEEN